jgi:hypothetical protein
LVFENLFELSFTIDRDNIKSPAAEISVAISRGCIRILTQKLLGPPEAKAITGVIPEAVRSMSVRESEKRK